MKIITHTLISSALFAIVMAESKSSGGFLTSLTGLFQSSDTSADSNSIHSIEETVASLQAQVSKLSEDNEKMRSVIYKLLQMQQSKSEPNTKSPATHPATNPATHSTMNSAANHPIYNEQFVQEGVSLERELGATNYNDDKVGLVWFRGQDSQIRMGSDSGNEVSLHGDNGDFKLSVDHRFQATAESMTFQNSAAVDVSQVGIDADNVHMSSGQHSLTASVSGKQATTEEFTSSIQVGETLMGFGKPQSEETLSGVSLVSDSVASVHVASTTAESSYAMRLNGGQSSIGLNDTSVEFRAGSAFMSISENEPEEGEDAYDFVLSSGDTMLAFGGGYHEDEAVYGTGESFRGVRLDTGENGSFVVNAGEASLTFSDGSRGTENDEWWADSVAPYDLVLAAGHPDNEENTQLTKEQSGSVHLIAGAARMRIGEYNNQMTNLTELSQYWPEYANDTHNFTDTVYYESYGGVLQSATGTNMLISGGNAPTGGNAPDAEEKNIPGSVVLRGGTGGRDENGTQSVGNIHIGHGPPEGFTGIYTATLSLTLELTESNQNYFADVYLRDGGTCGIMGYTSCSIGDMVFVNIPGAFASSQWIDLDTCQVRILVQYLEPEGTPSVMVEDFSHLMVIQRLNTYTVDGEC